MGGDAERALSDDRRGTLCFGGERTGMWDVLGEVTADATRALDAGSLRDGDCVGEDGGEREALDLVALLDGGLIFILAKLGDVADL
jgi:hypothetical protein